MKKMSNKTLMDKINLFHKMAQDMSKEEIYSKAPSKEESVSQSDFVGPPLPTSQKKVDTKKPIYENIDKNVQTALNKLQKDRNYDFRSFNKFVLKEDGSLGQETKNALNWFKKEYEQLPASTPRELYKNIIQTSLQKPLETNKETQLEKPQFEPIDIVHLQKAHEKASKPV